LEVIILKIQYSDISLADSVCRNGYDKISNYKAISIGRRSYVLDAKISSETDFNIIVGNYSTLGKNVQFINPIVQAEGHVTNYPWYKLPEIMKNRSNSYGNQVIIGNDVNIADDVTIGGGVFIGNGAVISEGAYVNESVPPYAVVAGNPAKIVNYRFDEALVEKINTIKWWYWDEQDIIANQEYIFGDVETFIEKFYISDNEVNSAPNLDSLRDDGFILYTFIPDFSDGHPVWREVICDYLAKFSSKDKTALILGLDEKPEHAVFIQEILDMIKGKGIETPKIFNVTETQEVMFCVIKSSNYFITTKDFKCLHYSDYAHDYNTKVLSGLDNCIFG
jgi:virginiamycin A acetyltransferase